MRSSVVFSFISLAAFHVVNVVCSKQQRASSKSNIYTHIEPSWTEELHDFNDISIDLSTLVF